MERPLTMGKAYIFWGLLKCHIGYINRTMDIQEQREGLMQIYIFFKNKEKYQKWTNITIINEL